MTDKEVKSNRAWREECQALRQRMVDQSLAIDELAKSMRQLRASVKQLVIKMKELQE